MGMQVLAAMTAIEQDLVTWKSVAVATIIVAIVALVELIFARGRNKYLEQRLNRETELRQRFERLNKIDHDTGVSNKASFQEARKRLEQDPDIWLIMFDGNNFGQINKQLSQDDGDAMILELAKAITKAAGSAHQVWRIGGDEFAVAVEGSYEDAHSVEIAARRNFAPRNPVGELVISLEGGIGSTLGEANENLKKYKRWQKESGADMRYLEIIREREAAQQGLE